MFPTLGSPEDNPCGKSGREIFKSMLDARGNEERITGRDGMSLARYYDFPLSGVNEVELILSMGRLRIIANRRVELNRH